MSRAREIPCACGAEMVGDVAELDDGGVTHVDAYSDAYESAHSAAECVTYAPGARHGNRWLVTRAAADEHGRKGWTLAEGECPEWARGYMAKGGTR